MAPPPKMEDFVCHLSAMGQDKPFRPSGYADHLLGAARSTKALDHFKDKITTSGGVSQGAKLDGHDCGSLIEAMVAATAAHSIANFSTDSIGFQQAVDKDASESAKSTNLGKLMPYLYGQHVNEYLQSKIGMDLKELSKDKTFVENYRKGINRPHTAVLGKLHSQSDVQRAHNFSMNLLFVHEYLQHGQPFPIATEVSASTQNQVHDCTEGSANTTWAGLLHHWCSTAKEACPELSDFDQHITSLAGSASAVFAPKGDIRNNTPCHLAANAFNGSSDCCKKIVTSVDATKTHQDAAALRPDSEALYTTLAQQLLNAWEIAAKPLVTAVKTAVTDKKTVNIPAEPMYVGGPDPVIMPMTSTDVTTYGKSAYDFMKDFENAGFFKSGSLSTISKNMTKYDVKGPFGCFAPGTLVHTAEGEKAIETIESGVSVKGSRSVKEVSECAKIPFGGGMLFGFNGGKPFFTANHCFYTTTGIRAVDPRAAKRQNPWAQVGPLQVGHVLLHSTDGETLSYVALESLSCEETTTDTVYDLYFNGDENQSYFANGFLVQANMPENNSLKIAKILSYLTPAQQVAALTKLPELQATFERFGTTTVLQSFQQQLRDKTAHSRTLDPDTVVQSKAYSNTSLAAINRTWTLEDDSSNADQYAQNLPVLSVFDNVLSIDGQYCERARIKPSLLLWTRQVDEKLYEHGFCKFVRPLYKGNGGLFYSEDPDASEVPESGIRTFTATIAQTSPYQALESAPAAAEEAVSELKISNSVADNALFAQTTSLETKDDKPLPAGSVLPKEYKGVENIFLKYDAVEWQPSDGDQTDQPLKQPVDLFELTMVDFSQDVGLPCLEYRVVELDRLQNLLTIKTQKENQIPLPNEFDIYESYTETINGDQTIIIMLKEPTVLYKSSDQYDPKTEKGPVTNLTYKNVGMGDFKLPFLFSTFSVKIPFMDDPSGAIRTLDTTKADYTGARHTLRGEYRNSVADSVVRAQLVEASMPTTVTALHARLDSLTISHLAPAPALFSKSARLNTMTKAANLDARRIYQLELDNKLLVDTAQDFIYKSMLYHMRTSDRTDIMNADVPVVGRSEGNLPPELAGGLETSMRDWLRDKYAPAVMAMSFANLSKPQLKDWIRKFDDAQVKKIKYWWTGKGKSCLANDDHYRRLNELSTAYAARRICPGLEPYLADDEPDAKGRRGGPKWAAAYLAIFEGMGTMVQKGLRLIGGSKDNYLRVLNLIQALHPIGLEMGEKTPEGKALPAPCVKLAELVQNRMLLDAAGSPYAEVNTSDFWKKKQNFVLDAMGPMIDKLMRRDPAFAKLRKAFDDCVVKVQEKVVDFAKMDAASKVEKIRQMMLFQVADAVGGIDYLYKNWQACVADKGVPGTLWEKAQYCADRSFRVDGLVDTSWKYWAPLFTGLVSVGLAACDIYMAVTRFSDLTPAGKAKSITACVRSVVNVLGQIPDVVAVIKGRSQWMDLRAAGRRATASTLSIELQPRGSLDGRSRSASLASQPEELDPVDPRAKSGWSQGGRRFFAGILLFLAVCMAVFSVWELFQDKDGYESGYWLVCLQVSVQCLQVAVEVVAFFSAAMSTTSVVCAFLGPALALVGIVLMILVIFLAQRKRTKTTKAEDWIEKEGKAFTDSCDNPPDTKLSWTMTPESGNGGSDAVVTLSGTNLGSEDVTLDHVQMNFTTGASASTWFSSQQSERWTDLTSDDTSKMVNNQVSATLSGVKDGVRSSTFSNDPIQLGSSEKDWSKNYTIIVRNRDRTLALKVPKGATLTVRIKGVLGKKSDGEGNPNNVFSFPMEETWIDNEGVVVEVVAQHFMFTKT